MLYLFVVPFSVFLISRYNFNISEKISTMTPYFFLVKMINRSILFQPGTFFNFVYFLIGFFLSSIETSENIEKFLVTISVIDTQKDIFA